MLNCKCHYTSIYKKYTEWVKLQVFKNVYNILFQCLVETRTVHINYKTRINML